jgi:hypothetical protein
MRIVTVVALAVFALAAGTGCRNKTPDTPATPDYTVTAESEVLRPLHGTWTHVRTKINDKCAPVIVPGDKNVLTCAMNVAVVSSYAANNRASTTYQIVKFGGGQMVLRIVSMKDVDGREIPTHEAEREVTALVALTPVSLIIVRRPDGKAPASSTEEGAIAETYDRK